MDVLIKKACIIAPGNPYHEKIMDVFIKNGTIHKIAKNIGEQTKKVIQGDHLHLSIGWMDIGTQVGEPGFEQRENIDSVCNAAAKGGFTSIASFPNTFPSIQSKSEINFIKNSSNAHLVNIYPIGAVSKDTEGNEISEMIDMTRAGAVAFSDGKRSVDKSSILLKALLYVKSFKGIIIQRSEDESLSQGGLMHEGLVSTSLGMTGMPDIAEHVAAIRDIKLNEYAESKLCLHTVSSADTVELIKKHQKKNNQLYATVSYMNITQTDDDLEGFNENFKVVPPIRTKKDQRALIKGLKDGTIHAIVSNHDPKEDEIKHLEFSNAAFGAIGLESCYAVVNENLGEELGTTKIVDLLAYGPRIILDIDIPEIKEGEKADLCIFDPTEKWTFEKSTIASKSFNSPYLGKELMGRVKHVIRGNKMI